MPSEAQDLAPLAALIAPGWRVHLALRDVVSEAPMLFSPDPQLFTNEDDFGGPKARNRLIRVLENSGPDEDW